MFGFTEFTFFVVILSRIQLTFNKVIGARSVCIAIFKKLYRYNKTGYNPNDIM